MKKLNIQTLKTRRAFLKAAAKKSAIPVIAVYTLGKSIPKVFAREPD